MKILATWLLMLTVLPLLAAPPASQANDGHRPLRQLAQSFGFYMGAAAEPHLLTQDPQYGPMLAGEYNALTPENALKFGPLSPARGVYNFQPADALVAFAGLNGMRVRGHTLVWHEQLPAWFVQGRFSRDELLVLLENHIKTVVGRYRGRIAAWDVVNEALDFLGTLRFTPWLTGIGPEYIELAFRWAHEADPNALLFYNDYDIEGRSLKSQAAYNLVKGLVERGVPIHGVGFQMHVGLHRAPNIADVRANMDRLAALGLKVEITEMDVTTWAGTGTLDERLQAQAEIYRQVLELCVTHPACIGFTTWGFTDRYTWIPRHTGHPDVPLPLDTNYLAKPAYQALSDVLAARVPPPSPSGPAVAVEVSPSNGVGMPVFVTLRLHDVADVYGVQARCQANPAVLEGITFLEGDKFQVGNSLVVDSGFNAADGSWLVAASRLNPHPPITGDGTAFGLAYLTRAAGDAGVSCEVLVSDSDGRALPLPVTGGVGAPPPGPVLAPAAPSQFSPPPPSSITGLAISQRARDNAGVQVRLEAGEQLVGEVLTQSDGAFQFTGVAPGAYQVRLAAVGRVPVLLAVSVLGDGQPVGLQPALLPAGDATGDARIDLADASFIGANFGLPTPPAPVSVDLNQDGQVNVGDLVLVGRNFGMVGPINQ